MGLALAFTTQDIVLATGAVLLASRRRAGLGGRRVAAGLTRMYIAAVPGASLALGVLWLVEGMLGLNSVSALVILAAGGGLGFLLYAAVAHGMRVSEVRS